MSTPPTFVHTVYLVLRVDEVPELAVTVLFASLNAAEAIEEYNKVSGQVGISLTRANYLV